MTNTRKILLACIPVEIAVAVAFVAASTSGSSTNSTLGSAHAAFDHGEFELAFQLASRAIWTLPPNDTSESLFHIMDIARRRRWYTEHDVRLPTNAAWALESKSMSREKRIQYLCQRIELLPNVVFRENFSGDDFGMSCRGFGGCRFEVIS
jgi:hypothetical protein